MYIYKCVMFITKSNVIWDCCETKKKKRKEEKKKKKEDFSFFPSVFHSFFFFSSQESLGSSFTLELQNINMMMEGYYSAAFSAFPEEMSLFSSATTTGYLQDAIAEWSNRSCKRRRNCWDYNEDTVAVPSDENFGSCFTSYNLLPDNNPSTSFGNDIKSTTVDHPTETTREPERLKNISSLCSSFYLDSATSCSKKGDKRRKVVYPFDMVKPGGIEGDVTLNDINERILMPPRRPIRHPVGDMAGNPCVFMSGLGPSGKAVVALTRIRTQGRGTVIIIRTRG